MAGRYPLRNRSSLREIIRQIEDSSSPPGGEGSPSSEPHPQDITQEEQQLLLADIDWGDYSDPETDPGQSGDAGPQVSFTPALSGRPERPILGQRVSIQDLGPDTPDPSDSDPEVTFSMHRSPATPARFPSVGQASVFARQSPARQPIGRGAGVLSGSRPVLGGGVYPTLGHRPTAPGLPVPQPEGDMSGDEGSSPPSERGNGSPDSDQTLLIGDSQPPPGQGDSGRWGFNDVVLVQQQIQAHVQPMADSINTVRRAQAVLEEQVGMLDARVGSLASGLSDVKDRVAAVGGTMRDLREDTEALARDTHVHAREMGQNMERLENSSRLGTELNTNLIRDFKEEMAGLLTTLSGQVRELQSPKPAPRQVGCVPVTPAKERPIPSRRQAGGRASETYFRLTDTPRSSRQEACSGSEEEDAGYNTSSVRRSLTSRMSSPTPDSTSARHSHLAGYGEDTGDFGSPERHRMPPPQARGWVDTPAHRQDRDHRDDYPRRSSMAQSATSPARARGLRVGFHGSTEPPSMEGMAVGGLGRAAMDEESLTSAAQASTGSSAAQPLLALIKDAGGLAKFKEPTSFRSARTFLDEYKFYADIVYSGQPQLHAKCFYFMLDGRAKLWYKDAIWKAGPVQKANPAWVYEKFLDYFEREAPPILSKSYASRIQRSAESVSEYSKVKKEMLHNLAYPEAVKVDFFVQGLKPNIRRMVETEMPANLRLAETAAVKAEVILTARDGARSAEDLAADLASSGCNRETLFAIEKMLKNSGSSRAGKGTDDSSQSAANSKNGFTNNKNQAQKSGWAAKKKSEGQQQADQSAKAQAGDRKQKEGGGGGSSGKSTHIKKTD